MYLALIKMHKVKQTINMIEITLIMSPYTAVK